MKNVSFERIIEVAVKQMVFECITNQRLQNHRNKSINITHTKYNISTIDKNKKSALFSQHECQITTYTSGTVTARPSG